MRVTQLVCVLALSGALSGATFAQSGPEVKLPASPMGQTAVQMGGTWAKTDTGGQQYRDGKWIVVDYSRPLLRGRTNIFGQGAEYGKSVYGNAPIWRAGANATTRLTTQAPLVFGGKTIEPGVYNVFVELKPGNWTLVLNTQAVQEKYDPNDKVKLFGEYNYDTKFDVVRVPMNVRTTEVSVEQFTIAFVNVTGTKGTLAMSWENTLATVDFAIADRAAPK